MHPPRQNPRYAPGLVGQPRNTKVTSHLTVDEDGLVGHPRNTKVTSYLAVDEDGLVVSLAPLLL